MQKAKVKMGMLNRNKLAVYLQPDALHLLLFDKTRVIRYESLLLRETLEHVLASKITHFMAGRRPSETLLVLPRGEVLQKDFMVGSKLAQVLPYSPKEMAYGFTAQSSAASKTLLYAVPEKRIRQILEFFAKLGIRIDEIVSEDQCLWWLMAPALGQGPLLVVDHAPERFLFLLARKEGIFFSRQYAKADESLESMISEISILSLESGVKPAGAVLCGVGERERGEIAELLKLPLEFFHPDLPRDQKVPAVMLGAVHWGRQPVASLLPHDLKIRKWKVQKRKLWRESLAAFVLFAASFSGLLGGHLWFLKGKAAALEKEIAMLAPQAVKIKDTAASLQSLRNAEYSKDRLLEWIKELANQVPLPIRLQQLEMRENDIVLEAESPSHELLTQTVQVFEKSEWLKEVKLEHTRLRKRLNQDYFEFEITAQWKGSYE